MSITAESLLKRTGKSLSILAFETSKQSRIMKKKMRITALQKEVKADLRDLGRIVYEAALKGNDDVLNNEEVSILVDNVTRSNAEIDRLRESMERISRAKKTFDEEEENFTAPASAADSTPDEVPLEPAKEAEAAPEQKNDDSAAEQPEVTVEAAVETTQESEPPLEEKPKPTRAKRTTTPRKRKNTKTAAKSKAKTDD